MFQFARTIQIAAPITRVYDFHLHTTNAPWIMPPAQKIVGIKMPEIIAVGAQIELRVRQWGWTQVWLVRWEMLQPPEGEPQQAKLIDVAMKSPFKSWRHTHSFCEMEHAVELTDLIEYEMPFGFLGRKIQPWVEKELAKTFAFRQERTKAILEEAQQPTKMNPMVYGEDVPLR